MDEVTFSASLSQKGACISGDWEGEVTLKLVVPASEKEAMKHLWDMGGQLLEVTVRVAG